ncbi:MAG: sugar phosphate isomerase/epimerase family protein [Planctomycetaceae bacterium]
MNRLRLAVATRALQLPLKASLRRAAEIGVSGLMLDARKELAPGELSETGRRQLLHMTSELELSVVALDFPTRRPLHDMDRLELRLKALREAMQLAAQLNANVVTVRTGRIPQEPESDETKILIGILNDLARYGNHVGVTVALSPSADQPEPMLRVIEAVTDGPVGLSFDPAAFVMAGVNPSEGFRSFHSRVMHVVARDAVRDADAGVEVSIGRGEVAWDELLALLDEAGYPGWLTVDRTQGDDRPGDVARAVQYLKRIAFG